MCLGALIDCGLPWHYLVDNLQSLGIDSEYQLRTEKVIRNGQAATKVYVDLQSESKSNHGHQLHHHSARHLTEILNLIDHANLPLRVKQWSIDIFKRLAIAESEVHGIPPEKVHFHEVGATDAIVDIVGTCIGLDWLNIEELHCSPLPTGGGTVRAAHGILSVPVPAVIKLWEKREVPIYSNGIQKELVTPTGAAIAVTLATSFGDPPTMQLSKIGLGAGSRDLEIPNILRLWIGSKIETKMPPLKVQFTQETVTVLETQIDDLSPQVIAYTAEQLMAQGALDVFSQSIGMKKSRSGILLTVICRPELSHTCKTIIFSETTTIGIRERNQPRSILNREIKSIKTQYGTVKVKIASWGKGAEKKIINLQPEYEDCAELARKYNLPWQKVSDLALREIYQSLEEQSK